MVRATSIVAAASVVLSACFGLDSIAIDRQLTLTDMTANPVRRVVTLLQKMAKKVAQEGEKEAELYDKFRCYCQTGGGDLAQSIAQSTAKVPQLQTDIETTEASVKQMKLDLKAHQADRSAAKTAIAEAQEQREKEHAKFVEESTQQKSYITALSKAIPAIEKGMAGGFLQASLGSNTRELLQAVSSDVSVTDDDHQLIAAFLSNGASSSGQYVPKGGEIVGILKNIKEDFEKSLADVESAEAESVKLSEALVQAKTKEVQTLTDNIEKKTARVGEQEVAIVNMKNDLTETEAALIEDQKFAANLEKDCETKAAEWEERKKTRAEELVAIHDTIKILNDDDALELFKKTLPSASLLQVSGGRRQLAARALALVRAAGRPSRAGRPGLDFLAMALTGRKVDFSKVIKMIDDMVALLAQEQVDDDSKKEYCEKQLDTVEDKAKELSKKINDLEASIAEKEDMVKELAAEIKELTRGVAELDKQVADSTALRREQHEEYEELIASDSSAKELLGMAKNRLNKFYNKKLYKAPPERELSREEQIEANMNSEASLMEVAQHHRRLRDEPAPAPTTWEGGYSKKGEDSGGVIAMIDLLIKDLDKEMTEAKTEENNSQQEYEDMMNDAAKKRAADLKSLSAKETARADAQEGRVKDQESAEVQGKELQATKMYEMQLHQECDWLVQNFDMRKEARAQESDMLKQAKAVLSGADFSFAQLRAQQW